MQFIALIYGHTIAGLFCFHRIPTESYWIDLQVLLQLFGVCVQQEWFRPASICFVNLFDQQHHSIYACSANINSSSRYIKSFSWVHDQVLSVWDTFKSVMTLVCLMIVLNAEWSNFLIDELGLYYIEIGLYLPSLRYLHGSELWLIVILFCFLVGLYYHVNLSICPSLFFNGCSSSESIGRLEFWIFSFLSAIILLRHL